MFACEARGLRWLAEARALRIPRGDRGRAATRRASVPRARAGSQPAPRGARLRRAARPRARGAAPRGAPRLRPRPRQLHRDLAADEHAARRLARVLRERRLEPQLERAVDARPRRRTALQRGFERLCARMPELVRPGRAARAPARRSVGRQRASRDERGAPVLIDPAVYGGHREIDLAMMRLFGGFGARCFARVRRSVSARRTATRSASRCISSIRCSCTSTCSAAATSAPSNARFHRSCSSRA